MDNAPKPAHRTLSGIITISVAAWLVLAPPAGFEWLAGLLIIGAVIVAGMPW